MIKFMMVYGKTMGGIYPDLLKGKDGTSEKYKVIAEQVLLVYLRHILCFIYITSFRFSRNT